MNRIAPTSPKKKKSLSSGPALVEAPQDSGGSTAPAVSSTALPTGSTPDTAPTVRIKISTVKEPEQSEEPEQPAVELSAAAEVEPPSTIKVKLPAAEASTPTMRIKLGSSVPSSDPTQNPTAALTYQPQDVEPTNTVLSLPLKIKAPERPSESSDDERSDPDDLEFKPPTQSMNVLKVRVPAPSVKTTLSLKPKKVGLVAFLLLMVCSIVHVNPRNQQRSLSARGSHLTNTTTTQTSTSTKVLTSLLKSKWCPGSGSGPSRSTVMMLMKRCGTTSTTSWMMT